MWGGGRGEGRMRLKRGFGEKFENSVKFCEPFVNLFFSFFSFGFFFFFFSETLKKSCQKFSTISVMRVMRENNSHMSVTAYK